MSCPKCNERYTLVGTGVRVVQDGPRWITEEYRDGYCPKCHHTWDERREVRP